MWYYFILNEILINDYANDSHLIPEKCEEKFQASATMEIVNRSIKLTKNCQMPLERSLDINALSH